MRKRLLIVFFLFILFFFISIPIISYTSSSTLNPSSVIAAVSAALAEELGEDVKGIRILSFKKIG